MPATWKQARVDHPGAREEVVQGPEGRDLLDNLRIQCFNRLADEAIMLQEVDRAGFSPTKDAGLELEAYMDGNGFNLDTFKVSLKSYGFEYAHFKKKFENQVLIQDYLESGVMRSAATEFDRQSLFDQWFANAKSLVNIIYYDKELERLVQETSTGSSCCPE